MTDDEARNAIARLKRKPRDKIRAAALASGGYPYREKMSRAQYERQLRKLQIELVKLQRHARAKGLRIVALFEGRDAAGKGGVIKRFMEHLNPRYAHAVALQKPTETERGQWYFQRYVAHLPTAGDMTLFDRSWYNRAGVERVFGFCTSIEYQKFLVEAPEFERAIQRDGILLFKYWLNIGREAQLLRFHKRATDPLKTWKLSPIDLAALDKWDEYTEAKQAMMRATHSADTPWTAIKANDKRRARINCIRHFLHRLNYEDKDEAAIGEVDLKIVVSGAEEM
ncbi:MAG: polyphosphate kinase 2 [Parvularculaceae bacterium]